MPPQLALLVCLCFVAWLFLWDKKQRQFTSRALWIPFLWLFIIGSRPVSSWFGGGDSGGDLGGDPVNTLFYGALMLGAIVTLQRRNFNWGGLIRNNKALCLIYLFFAISVVWSPLGIITLKRLVKDFGCVLVGLVLLTEVDPSMAIRTVFVRVAYLLFPLSIVVSKYYPAIGRNFSDTGIPMITGLTTQKNSLGAVVVTLGVMILWDLIELWKENAGRRWNTDMLVRYGVLAMGLWLLLTCDSVTSIVCLMLGAFLFWGGGRMVRMRNGRRVLVYSLIGLLGLAALNGTFHIFDNVVEAFGRNPTLTGRTTIWQVVLDQHTDPLIGCGFYSFWQTKYGYAVNQVIGMGLNEAHNGYLETYLDGGWVGVALLALLLLAVGARAIKRLFSASLFGRVAFIFWIIAIVYNYSESDYFRLSPIWFTFLLLTVESARQPQEAEEPVAVSEAAGFSAQK